MKYFKVVSIIAVIVLTASGSVTSAEINSDNSTAKNILCMGSVFNVTSEVTDIQIPVGLIYFKYETERNNVTLSWLTIFENNNSRFEIERQGIYVYGHEDWSTIGSVAGMVSSNISTNYTFKDERVSTGKYNYRLRQIDMNDEYTYFNLNSEVEIGIKKVFKLSQNYPNPFNPSTKIDFEIHNEAVVKIMLYDLSGKEIKTLHEEFRNPGFYTLSFNGDDLAGGVYIYRMEVDGILKNSKQMILLK